MVLDGGRVLGASRPELSDARLPRTGSKTLDGQELRVASLGLDGFDGQNLTLRVTRPATSGEDSSTSWIVIGALAGFLLLAIAFAITVSRTLQAEVQSLLVAARAIGRGDFSKRVPTEGNDEFAALGKEFNSMAEELESRLEELQRERARLADAIRRVGESFTKSLDRVGLLEIVVQTAVDGVEAACGRATIRPAGRSACARSPPPAIPTPTSASCTPPRPRRWTRARSPRSSWAARARWRRRSAVTAGSASSPSPAATAASRPASTSSSPT